MNSKPLTCLILGSTILFVAVLLSSESSLQGQVLDNPFDQDTGTNVYYGGLGDDNWASAGFGVAPNAGAEFLASANGNASGIFFIIGLTKDIGGLIADETYTVSFWVTKYLGLQGIELSDFSSLRIGEATGSMQWVMTPQPVTDGIWVQWFGTFAPSPTDLGKPFKFEAIFKLDGMHSIALDGPIVATPLPRLSVRRVGSNAEVSWSVGATNFVLEAATSLPAISWATVTNTPTVTATNRSVQLPLTGPAQFFRLRKP